MATMGPGLGQRCVCVIFYDSFVSMAVSVFACACTSVRVFVCGRGPPCDLFERV